MAQYNVATRAVLSSITTSGTGNKVLTSAELRALVDNVTISGGAALSSSNVLYLDIDLGNRIYLDSFIVYIDSAASRETIEANLGLYYKNNATDFFTKVGTSDNSLYYFASSLPTTFAPLSCRITMSGVDCTIREIVLYNNDYSVAFGSDGSLTEYTIDDAPTGGSSAVHTIPIFNNDPTGTPPVTAFISIDYSGNSWDKNLKLSSDGDTFYSWEDGPSLSNNVEGEAYFWNMGTLSGTSVSGTSVRLNNTLSGTYTTPIFQFNGRYGRDEINIITASGVEVFPTYKTHIVDQFSPSYVVVEETLVSGTSITKTVGAVDATMEVRSSNTAPKDTFEVYWNHRHATSGTVASLLKIDVLTGTVTSNYRTYTPTGYAVVNVWATGIDLFTGMLFFSVNAPSWSSNAWRWLIDKNGNHVVAASADGAFMTVPHIDWQSNGYYWVYSTGSYTLRSYLYNSFTAKYSITESSDWVTSYSAEPFGSGVWLHNKLVSELQYYSDTATLVFGISMSNSVKLVAATLDGGCWVYTIERHMMERYNTEGEKISEFGPVTRDGYQLTFIAIDRLESDGLWLVTSVDIRHVTSTGEIIGAQTFGGTTGIHVTERGLVATNNITQYLMVLDPDCNILFLRNLSSYIGANISCANAVIYSYTHYETLRYNRAITIPVSDDPVWGTNGSLQWTEVKKTGYMLPKYRYHQFRFTLRSPSTTVTPLLDGVYMPMSVKIPDIYPQESKPLYIRADFEGVEDAIYTSKLKCWWTK